jgi:hypothetical protein
VVDARTPSQLAESLGALSISLSPSDLTRIEAAIPATAVAGDRYAAPPMQMLGGTDHRFSWSVIPSQRALVDRRQKTIVCPTWS